MRRRRFLVAATTGAIAFAGCNGKSKPPTSNTYQATTSNQPYTNDAEPTTESPTETHDREPSRFPETLAWTYHTENSIARFGPVVTDTAIYVPSSRLFALDLKGKLKWENRIKYSIKSPLVPRDSLYFIRGGRRGKTDALQSIEFDGTPRWTFSPNVTALRLLAVTDEIAFVGSHINMGEATGMKLYAVDVATGREHWNVKMNTPIDATTVDETIYVTSSRTVTAFSTVDGSRRWTWSKENESDTIFIAGANTKSNVLVIAGKDLYGLDLNDGSERWHFTSEGSANSTTEYQEDVVYTGSGAVTSLDVQDGNIRWATRTYGPQTEVKLATANKVYVGGEALVALDVVTGAEQWVIHDLPHLGGVVGLRDTIYATTVKNTIHAINKGGDRTWDLKFNSELTKPAAGSDRLYVTTQSGIVLAFDE